MSRSVHRDTRARTRDCGKQPHANARTSSDRRDNAAGRRRRRSVAFHRNRRTDGNRGRRRKQRELQRVGTQRHARSSAQNHARPAGQRRRPATPEEGLLVVIHDGRHVTAAAAVDDSAHGSGGALLAHRIAFRPTPQTVGWGFRFDLS